MMVFERKEAEMVNFRNPHKVIMLVAEKCEIVLGENVRFQQTRRECLDKERWRLLE